MLGTVPFAIAVLITFVGCAVLFVDVIVTKNTDFCQDEIPGEYIADKASAASCARKPLELFVLAAPEFKYEYDGVRYQGRSANVFFHLFLLAGQRAAPFIDGRTYRIFVNPAKPTMFVTDGEQRFAFLHLLGCGTAGLGIVLLLLSMGVI